MTRYGWTEDELYLVRERAHSLYLQWKHSEAAVLLSGAVALDPDDRYSRLALATVCLALGRPQQSLAHLDILIKRNPDDIEARACRCEALIDSGEIRTADTELRELRNIMPASQATQLSMRLEAERRSQWAG